MDDQRFGSLIRAARVKRRMTQRQLGSAAGVSDGSVSRLERGLADSLSMIRSIARVLDVRVELLPRSRAADLERVASAAHGALAEAVVAWLGSFDGWVVRPEVGFSHFGERGVIDLVCWHAARRALLIIELKTEIVDVNELLGTLDRHVRNGATAVLPLGWRPLVVARLLVIGDSDRNRDRVRQHAALFGAALPAGSKAVRAWLRNPAGLLAGMMFFANRHPTSTSARFATARRVRPASKGASVHESGARRPRGAARRPA
jgi:transcriptional regulator with XRE-family HTH domain